MSEIDQDEPQTEEQYGGTMASMFGFVTAEDRQRWSAQRRADADAKAKGKKGANKALNSMYKTMDRKHNAMERVVTQADFEQENVKATEMRFNAETQKLEEAVRWRAATDGPSQELHSDFDLEAGPEL